MLPACSSTDRDQAWSRSVRLDPCGATGPTTGQARGAGWRRSSHGLYVPSAVLRTMEQRVVEAAAVLPRGGAVTGWAALGWLGGHWFDGGQGRAELPVPLAVGHTDVRARAGLLISQERIRPGDVAVTDGLHHTSAVRSVCFEMRHARSVDDAVRVLDLACYDDLVSVAELSRHLDSLSGPWSGLPRARAAMELADENCWSPRESDTRRTWCGRAGLSTPLVNRPVFDLDGRHLATPDLFDPATGLAVEYDGELHLQGRRRRRDRDRIELLGDVGIETLVVMGGDPPGRVAERMRWARTRRLAAGVDTSRWTLELPPWWVPTFTVGQRRALTVQQRRRWLARRQTP